VKSTPPSSSASPLSFAGLHVLADDDPRWQAEPAVLAEAACRGGARVIQLRCKHRPDVEVLQLAKSIRQVTLNYGTKFVVNDRIDLALLCEADAVHLGQGDVPPARIPKDLRAQIAIGRSTHTLEQVRAARSEPIRYVAFGPVFETGSKDSPHSARGLPLLSEACALAAPLPLIAIGGIGREHLPHVRAAGAAGFAVIGAVAGSADPEAATRELVRAWAN